MTHKTASRSATAPLFRQIVSDLKKTIHDGDLAEHSPLPSERVVAQNHGVSRMTARRALEAVEAEGLAYSKGRMGRFVAPKRLDYNVSSMANFVADAARRGIEIDMELLDSKHMLADASMARHLAVSTGTPVFNNTRLFRRQGHATFLETETIIAARCAELTVNDTQNESDLPLQKRRYSALGHTADIVIRMCVLTPSEADILELMPYQAGIEQEQVVRDEKDEAFCFTRQVWRGETAQFSARAILQS